MSRRQIHPPGTISEHGKPVAAPPGIDDLPTVKIVRH